MKKISLMEVKDALKDPRFRDKLPITIREDVGKFLQNPDCSCNLPLYKKIIQNHKKELSEYYPNSVISEDIEDKNVFKNNFLVINCSVNELEGRLKKLSPGKKQISISRFEDQVTVVINELGD